MLRMERQHGRSVHDHRVTVHRTSQDTLLYFTLLYKGPSRADGNAAGPVRQCRDRTCHEVQVSERTHHSSIYIIHQRYWVGGRAGLTTESIDAGPLRLRPIPSP